MPTVFNSYTVFDKEGELIVDECQTAGTTEDYFKGLSLHIRQQAHVMLVLKEGGTVERYKVTQPVIPEPKLGPKESLE
ncbi:hypothetical protein LCGC14_2219240 [marine sediment metagenome]|uniref:Uncharacterized protein n=1 Tax=marine sediment metagenome TaxID=412755 RepID=A0A0F9A8K1_9ZZZZ